MTISLWELSLYAFGVFVLFLTPGPVWVALIARALSGGFHAAWPLALGVVVGDAVWPAAVLIFVSMGIGLIRSADRALGSDSRLTRPGMWAGFAAGVAVILSNPKAVLFYMGVLPGFFDLSRVTWFDIAAITLVSMVVPLLGNLVLAGFIDKVRSLLASPAAIKRVNLTSGALLILVGVIIGLIQ
jgi:threonine/homoserine/homoserine lactone efflux protein